MIKTTFISGLPPHPAPPIKAAPAIPAPAALRNSPLVRVFFTPSSPGRIQVAIIVILRPPGHAGNPPPCENARHGNYRGDGRDGATRDRAASTEGGRVAEAVWLITTGTGGGRLCGDTSSSSSTSAP